MKVEIRNLDTLTRERDDLRWMTGKSMEKLKLGPLTSRLLSEAKWKGQDKYPALQSYADECERLLEFAIRKGRWDRFWSRLVANHTRQRDSALNELRVAYHLDEKSFSVVNWDPTGDQTKEGEFLIQGISGLPIFIEVKSRELEGELFQFSEMPLTRGKKRRFSTGYRNPNTFTSKGEVLPLGKQYNLLLKRHILNLRPKRPIFFL